ncbi:acyltransferase family protein, partial [bacterium]|nr:acyltransferase family protein [bacterium]
MPTLSERQDKSLDYLRAAAALLVVGFHSCIVFPGLPLISDWAVLAIIRQGYIGVSLFLVLSGFLFMKLGLERGLPHNLGNFYINRLLRVGPLFLVIFTLATAIGRNNFEPGDLIYLFITNIGSPPTSDQFITGTAWSVSLELAFYWIFPYLGRFTRSGGIKYLANLIFLILFLKIAVFVSSDNFQLTMYSTLIGRIDQFFFGMIA